MLSAITNVAWLREWQVTAMLMLVGLIYCGRLTTLPLRGEETRRAMVAREILWTGDWIVPRQQGEPFLSRPPLGSYPIALIAMIQGDVTPFATRLPTALATMLTCLLIYGYCRQFVSSTGALAGSLGYASMGQVLQLGQIAETEAVFTLLVASSLIVWHWGYTRHWSPYAVWSAAYLFVALGALAKGPQAPVYFAATIGVFLLCRREWKALFHPAHFFGIGIFATVLGAWQIPFAWRLGWPAVREIWGGDVGLRFVDQTWQSTIGHLLAYPLEVWLYLLPSSLLLLAYLHPAFWRSIPQHHGWLSFAVIALVVTFPTCWFVPGAKPRYFMPLYPCVAIMMSVVVDELRAASATFRLRQIWLVHHRLLTGVMWGTIAVLAVWAFVPNLPYRELHNSMVFLGTLTAVAAVGTLILWHCRHRYDARAIEMSLFATTAFMGMLYSGVVVNASLHRSEDAATALAELKSRLPANAKLVSFGLLETMFTYHYGAPVEALSDKTGEIDLPASAEYFCINEIRGIRVDLPFAWQKEAVISCDRWKRDKPQRVVIVGRRLPQLASQSNTRDE